MFRKFIIWLAIFFVATIAVYIAVLAGTTTAWNFLGVQDRDGGGSMALAFIIGPAIALPAGAIIAFIAKHFIDDRRASQNISTADNRRRDLRAFAILGAVAGGYIATYYLVRLGFWFASPISLSSYWVILLISWLPTTLGLAGAAATASWVARRTRVNRDRPNGHAESVEERRLRP